VNFPVITLESLASRVHSAFSWLTNFEPLYLLLFGGKYLLVRCLSGDVSKNNEQGIENKTREMI